MTKQERLEEMVRLYLPPNEHTLREIGGRFGVTHERVRQLLDTAGIDRRRPGGLGQERRRERAELKVVQALRRQHERCPRCKRKPYAQNPWQGEICRSCWRREEVERLWNEGWTAPQIAEALGVSLGVLGQMMVRIRKSERHNLPRRGVAA